MVMTTIRRSKVSSPVAQRAGTSPISKPASTSVTTIMRIRELPAASAHMPATTWKRIAGITPIAVSTAIWPADARSKVTARIGTTRRVTDVPVPDTPIDHKYHRRLALPEALGAAWTPVPTALPSPTRSDRLLTA